MTSSVPYSFVPGTKAKAEEVNANFISVLNKIENANLKIENLNSEKLKTDLSNIDETGKEVLNKKADKTEIDGKWTTKTEYIANEVTMSTTYDKTFDLSQILPNDDNVYELLITAIIRTGSNTNNCTALFVGSSICKNIAICRAVTRVSGANQIASGNCIIPIGTDRKIRFFSGSEATASSQANGCSFRTVAYRKVS